MSQSPSLPPGAVPRTAGLVVPAGGDSVWITDHVDALYRFARRRLSAEDAEDVALESFAALYARAARGQVPDEPGAYLFAVARNRVADRLRRRGRGLETAPLPAGWEALCSEPLPAEVLEQRELVDAVHVALGLLPSLDRELLLGRHREGLSVDVLATRLGLTAKAAEMRLYRARHALRARLEEVGHAWQDGAPR